MKYTIPTFLIVISLFLFIQIIGLAINNYYLNSELPYGLKPPEVKEAASPWFFIGMIIIATAIIVLLNKLRIKLFMLLWYVLAITSCIAVSLSTILTPWAALVVALVLVLLKLKGDIFTHNIAEILTYGGVVAIFAPMLDLWSAFILLIIMSIYDYIAVFVTKHMINLAKIQQEYGILTGIVVRYKNEVAFLGGGDIAFTLLFAVAVLKQFGIASALFSIFGATILIGLLMLIGQKKKYYPAMPFVTAGSIAGLLISLI